MKTLLLLLSLGVVARATPIVFNLSGTTNFVTNNPTFAVGDTFTAQLTIDSSAIDAAPGDPAVGSYASLASSVQFSNGLTLSNVPFEYEVVNNYYLSALNTTYDAIAFYFEPPTFSLGFELRFATTTFANDFAVTPSLGALIPQGSPEIPNPTDWYFRDKTTGSFSYAQGSIISASVSSSTVPEAPAPIFYFGASLLMGLLVRWKAKALRV